MIGTDVLRRHVDHCRRLDRRNRHRPRTGLAETQEAGALAISDWTITEFSSALSIKVRTGHLEPAHRNNALATFNRLIAESFEILPVSGTHFRTAARFCERFELGLRAGDALHLVLALEHGATIVTLDKRFAAAGNAIGAMCTGL